MKLSYDIAMTKPNIPLSSSKPTRHCHICCNNQQTSGHCATKKQVLLLKNNTTFTLFKSTLVTLNCKYYVSIIL